MRHTGDHQLLLSVVDDFLELTGLRFTRSLLHTETGLSPGAYLPRAELCSQLDAQNIPKTDPLLRQLVKCGLSAPKLRLPFVKTSLSVSSPAGRKLCDDAKPSPDVGGVGDIRAFPGMQGTENGLDSHRSAGADMSVFSEREPLAHGQDLVSSLCLLFLTSISCARALDEALEAIILL